jgi:hypothetical protein
MSKRNDLIKLVYNKGYRVVNGNLFNPKKKQLKILLCKSKNYSCYKRTFDINNIKASIPIHRLVAYQKYGDKLFEDGILVRHKDGNSLNNLEHNILIGTHSDNMMDIPKEIRLQKAIYASSKLRRFSDKEVKDILKDREKGYTYKQLGNKYNVAKSTLSFFFNKALYTDF